MKLRNKKTGEIKELPDGFFCGDNLKTLTKNWEDYEEPKEYWYYDTTKNGVEKITHLEDKEKDQEIGNYFETKEEAEQAVEKLKAWKRLQDAGVTFQEKVIDCKWYLMPEANVEMITFKEAHKLFKDIDLVFGVKYNEGDN